MYCKLNVLLNMSLEGSEINVTESFLTLHKAMQFVVFIISLVKNLFNFKFF